jgi:hypothetical protein
MTRIPIHLGAYASLPREARSDARLNDAHLRAAIEATGCGGLEVPWASATFVADEASLVRLLEAGGSHVLTMVAATMEARADGRFGLASLDADGRRAAVELVRGTHAATVAMSDRAGRPVVAAVEVQSAASVDLSARDAHVAALAESLDEIAGWDWRGARVLLEHCDSALGVRPVKGFLPLDDELRALAALDRAADVGLGVNWGRSVLETRDTATAVDHVRRADAARLLGARAYSGVAAVDNPLGDAWADNHVAVSGPLAVDAGLGSSLLTPARVESFATAARGGLTIVKVNAPSGADSRGSLAIVAESFALVSDAVERAAANSGLTV